jgi:type VI secretion system secreted protein Hcp
MAFEAYLKIDNINGSSTDSTYTKWIELLSFSWGASNPQTAASGAGGASGKANLRDFSFTKQTDVASPELFAAGAQGSHFQKCVLVCRKAGGTDGALTDFIKVTFQNILIASFVEGGHNTDDAPMDQVSFSFQKADIQFLTDTSTPPTSVPGA